MKRIFFIIGVCFLGLATGSSAEVPKAKPHHLLQSLKTNAILDQVQGNIPDRDEVSQKPFVILMQDIHAQPDAQLKIERTLTSLEASLGPLTVLLEGGAGPADGSFFRSFPIPDIAQSVLQEYLQRGELSGAELRAASQETSSQYEGMENWPLYKKNRQAMREGSKKARRADRVVRKIAFEMDHMKDKYFSPRLLEFETQKDAYHAGKIDMLEYVNYLMQIRTGLFQGRFSDPKRTVPNASEGIKEYPILHQLAEIKADWTPELDKKAEAEKADLVKELEDFFDVRPRDTTDPSLVRGAQHAKIPPEQFQNLEKRAHFRQQIEDIKDLGFIAELEGLEDALPGLLIKSDKERKLFDKDRQYQLLVKLMHFELSRNEYFDLKRGLDPLSFENFIGSLKKEFPEDEIANFTLTPALSRQGRGSVSSSPQSRSPLKVTYNGVDKGEGSNIDLRPFVDFYELALRREQAFIQKIHSSLEGKKPVVVVAGGFHSQGIKDALQDPKISFISLMPRTEHIESNDLYLDLMLKEKYSYLSPKGSGGNARGALALATVLTYMSNPDKFKPFIGKTGEEIYDALRFDDLEANPYEVLSQWAVALEGLGTTEELLRQYQAIVMRLYLKMFGTRPARNGELTDREITKTVTKVDQIFGKLFLDNSTERFDQAKMDRFLAELKKAGERPNFHPLDVVLLVYGARWNLSYGEMVDRYRKFLRYEALPPDIPLAEYQRLNEMAFYFAVPRHSEQAAPITKIFDDYRSRTLRDFLNENPIKDLSGWETSFLIYTHLFPYEAGTPVADIEKHEDIRSNLDMSAVINQYPGVDEKDIYTSAGDGKFLILKERALTPTVQRVYEMVVSKVQDLQKELEVKYRNIFMADSSLEIFVKNLDRLDPTQEKDQVILRQIRDLALKARDVDRMRVGIEMEKKKLAEYARILRESPASSGALANFRRTRNAIASYYLDEVALANGVRRQDVREARELTPVKQETFSVLMRALLPLALKLEPERDPAKVLELLNAWRKSSNTATYALWQFIRSQGFKLNFSLAVISDKNYAKRRLPSSAFITRIAHNFDISTRLVKIPALPAEEFTVQMMTGIDIVYFLFEFMEKLARVIEADPEKGPEIAERDIDGILREELEGHKFPLGFYNLFLHEDDLRARLDERFAGRGFDRQAIESDLRRTDFRSRSPHERIDNEEALAKFMRGGGDTGKLIEHLASHLFVLFAFELDYSREYFRGQVREYFFEQYKEFPWIHLKMTPEETRGPLSAYQGQTYAEAAEGEAVKLFERWRGISGQSLGAGREERLFGEGDPRPGDIAALYDAVKRGDFRGLAPRDAFTSLVPKWLRGEIATGALEKALGITDKDRERFRAFLRAQFPQETRWQLNLERLSKNNVLLRGFLAQHPGLDPKILESMPFSKMLAGEAARPSAVHFLPAVAPSSEEDVLALTGVTTDKQTVYLYSLVGDLLRKGNLGEMIGRLRSNNVSNGPVRDILQRFEAVRVPKQLDLNKVLAQELRKGAEKGWGASIFSDRTNDLKDLPAGAKGSYVILHTAKELEDLPWLNEKVREIGFVLPALDPDEAKKLQMDLGSYGFTFKESEKGLLVWIEDLEKLLTRIGQEYQAALAQSKAA